MSDSDLDTGTQKRTLWGSELFTTRDSWFCGSLVHIRVGIFFCRVQKQPMFRVVGDQEDERNRFDIKRGSVLETFEAEII
jgi:hypothetical protein